MSEELEEDIVFRLKRLEPLLNLAPLIKILVGGASFIGTGLIGVTVWVLTQEWTNARQDENIIDFRSVVGDHSTKLQGIESWKNKYESTPRVTTSEVFALDKRLQRVEDQSAIILETLKKIEAKLP